MPGPGNSPYRALSVTAIIFIVGERQRKWQCAADELHGDRSHFIRTRAKSGAVEPRRLR